MQLSSGSSTSSAAPWPRAVFSTWLAWKASGQGWGEGRTDESLFESIFSTAVHWSARPTHLAHLQGQLDVRGWGRAWHSLLDLSHHALSRPAATYIKVYLLENGACLAKKKTKVAKKTCDPLYQQALLFDEGPQGKVLQVSVMGQSSKTACCHFRSLPRTMCPVLGTVPGALMRFTRLFSQPREVLLPLVDSLGNQSSGGQLHCPPGCPAGR